MYGEHPYVRWAIEVIENYVLYRKIINLRDDLPKELFTRRAGAFVTLHKLDGSLRGCIGTIEPTKENLALEIRDNAIAAATRDPRFHPVAPSELDEIVVHVDVLNPPERVQNLSELDPKKYGVILQKGWHRGLLLPDIEGVDTVEEQLKIAMLKAGIFDLENVEIFRFTVTRYK